MPRPNFNLNDLESRIESDYSNFSRDLFKVQSNNSHLFTNGNETSFDMTLESARSSFVQDIALVFNDK